MVAQICRNEGLSVTGPARMKSLEVNPLLSCIPKVEGELRALTTQLFAKRSLIVDRSYEALVKSDDGYADLESASKQDIRAHIAFEVDLWFRMLLTEGGITAKDLDVIADIGRRRVHQGIPLTSLMRAFRLCSLAMWRIFLEAAAGNNEARDGLLFILSPYLLVHFDGLAQSMAIAYLDEQYQRARWREVSRYQLISIVFSSPEDVAGFRKACEALNIDAAASYVAAAMDFTMPDVLPSRVEGELDQLSLAIGRHLKLDTNQMVRAVHRGRLVVWIPAARGDSILSTDRRMRKHAGNLAKSVPGIKCLGVGLMNQGPRGWAASVDEAFKALDFGRQSGGVAGCYMYSDMALSDSVLRSENVLRYLDSIIERLTYEPDLLNTLAVFFEHGQHSKQTSAALDIHPNTLNYRLGRIEDILEARLDDASWVARLAVAVRLRGLDKSG